jgi:hypothetical protein
LPAGSIEEEEEEGTIEIARRKLVSRNGDSREKWPPGARTHYDITRALQYIS